jgi:putative glutamine amidotransferase
LLIGVTDTLRGQDALDRYLRWLKRNIPAAELVILSSTNNNAADVDRCSGVLMTGGGDVDPRLYGAGNSLSLVSEVNEERDRFELDVVRRTQESRVPVLGICRGSQITNVALGGALVPDLQQAGYEDHRKRHDGDRRHAVSLQEGSILAGIARGTAGVVNSSHHQAVRTPGPGLLVAARSADGVVEALEREPGTDGPFLLLVQWHPERMADQDNPLSAGVIAVFHAAMSAVAPT